MTILHGIVRLTRPLYVLFAALTYLLGAGIAHYLGILDVPSVFWLGLAGALLAQASMGLLGEVFRPSSEPLAGVEDAAQRRALRDAALFLSIAALATLSVIAFILYKDDRLTTAPLTTLGASLAVVLLYGVPPARLMDHGFGELLLSIQIAYLVPAIGFLLQAGMYHRLLTASILPLTFLLLATLVALDFPAYAEDLRFGRLTLLNRIGWRAAVPLHHGLLTAGYVLLAASSLLGLSLRLLWPAFLTIPFALLQINFIRNIALGAKPIWGLLTATALAVFCLTTYLLSVSFWLR